MDDKPLHFLREWRKHNRMTQGELAEAVGTAHSVISDLERGVVQITDKWLRRIAPVLKTSPGYILDHKPEDLDNDVIDMWSRVDLRDRPQAMRVLKSFARGAGDK